MMSSKRHKINSIHYGAKVLGGGGLLWGLGIVIVTWARNEVVQEIGRYLSGVGLVILGFMVLWLIIEGFQDRYWNHYDLSQRKRKVKLENGHFECQNCGNRNVKESEQICSICGCHFENRNED